MWVHCRPEIKAESLLKILVLYAVLLFTLVDLYSLLFIISRVGCMEVRRKTA